MYILYVHVDLSVISAHSPKERSDCELFRFHSTAPDEVAVPRNIGREIEQEMLFT